MRMKFTATRRRVLLRSSSRQTRDSGSFSRYTDGRVPILRILLASRAAVVRVADLLLEFGRQDETRTAGAIMFPQAIPPVGLRVFPRPRAG